ncbi:MAG: hypothetical protein ACT4QD_12275 [Acidobacteriota bacterium]
MADQPGETRRRGLVRFDEGLAEEVFAFQREAYPSRRPDWIEPRWRWMFEQSARRLGVAPMVWLYCQARGVVAHQGAIPVRLHTEVGDCTTGWFVETMALEQVRGKAIGPMLVAKAKGDLPFNLSLGQTEQMRELQYRLGWKKVADLETLVFVLRGSRVVAGKLPRPLEALGGAALETWQRVRAWRGRQGAHGHGLTVREVERFSDAHDRLWRQVQVDYPVAVVRDASYLNWKYVDQPGQSFIRLELCRSAQVLASAVLSISEPNAVYSTRRAWLTDVVVSPLDDEVVWAVFDAARQTAERQGADVVIFEVISEPLVEQALRFGFIRRAPSRHLLVSAEEPPSVIARHALDGKRWFVTRGDSDIDRPW